MEPFILDPSWSPGGQGYLALSAMYLFMFMSESSDIWFF